MDPKRRDIEDGNVSDQRNGQGHASVVPPVEPSRRHRAIEREYLATLSETVTLHDWREIVLAAVKAAKGGEPRAREWSARLLLGGKPMTITELAADEACEHGPEQEIGFSVAKRQHNRELDELLH